MRYDDLIVAQLPATRFVLPVGQGSMAIEVVDSIDPDLKNKIRESVNHPETEVVLTAERAYLKKLEGGCSIPAFTLAECDGARVQLTAGLISLDRRRIIKKIVTGKKSMRSSLGEDAGRQILEDGGRALLAEIKNSQE